MNFVTPSDGFTGPISFPLPNTVPLTPGTTYYFTFNVLAAGDWHVDTGGYNYLRGQPYVRGNALDPSAGFWFREGIIVPEPPPAALLSLGAVALLCLRRRSRSKQAVPSAPCRGVPLSTKPAKTALTSRSHISGSF